MVSTFELEDVAFFRLLDEILKGNVQMPHGKSNCSRASSVVTL